MKGGASMAKMARGGTMLSGAARGKMIENIKS